MMLPGSLDERDALLAMTRRHFFTAGGMGPGVAALATLLGQ